MLPYPDRDSRSPLSIQDKVYGYYGDAIIQDGVQYGAVLSLQKSNQLSIDLTYMRQGTTFDIKDYYNIGKNNLSGSYSGTVNYYMLGASASPDFTAKIAPYGGFMLGMAVFGIDDASFSEEAKFALGGKLGAIVHLNDRFGLVVQTQLMVPVQGVGLGVGCGTGGCGGGAYSSSTATQLGFTGGLEIKLSN